MLFVTDPEEAEVLGNGADLCDTELKDFCLDEVLLLDAFARAGLPADNVACFALLLEEAPLLDILCLSFELFAPKASAQASELSKFLE